MTHPILTPGTTPKRVDMDAVRHAAGGALTLPSVPRVVRKLIGQLKTPDVSVNLLVGELEQEPQLAARTLRIANSSYYCGRRSVASLFDAVAVIGTDTLRTLVVSCGLQAVFVDIPGVNLRQFWRDASITAKSARAIARMAGAHTGSDPDAAYLAGLLHGVGHLILCQAFAAQLLPALTGTSTLRGGELAALEQEACGLAHPQVGAAWLDELGFPQEISGAVAHQLDMPPPQPSALAAVLSLALQMTLCIETGDSPESTVEKFHPAMLAAASLRPGILGETFSSYYRDIVAEGADA